MCFVNSSENAHPITHFNTSDSIKLNEFPVELLENIFQYLPGNDIAAASSTCKRFYAICQGSKKIKKNMVRERYNKNKIKLERVSKDSSIKDSLVQKKIGAVHKYYTEPQFFEDDSSIALTEKRLKQVESVYEEYEIYEFNKSFSCLFIGCFMLTCGCCGLWCLAARIMENIYPEDEDDFKI